MGILKKGPIYKRPILSYLPKLLWPKCSNLIVISTYIYTLIRDKGYVWSTCLGSMFIRHWRISDEILYCINLGHIKQCGKMTMPNDRKKTTVRWISVLCLRKRNDRRMFPEFFCWSDILFAIFQAKIIWSLIFILIDFKITFAYGLLHH